MEEKNEYKYSLNKFFDYVIKHPTWAVFIIYASGFFVWNIYLSTFGFFEYNLVQIRYLSAGIILWTPVFLFYFLVKNKKVFCILTIISIMAVICLFPLIPQYIGGAKPIPTMILGAPDQITFLSNYDVRKTENAGRDSVQTGAVCLIYQNDNYILFFNATDIGTTQQIVKIRILSITRDKFSGFQQAVDEDYSKMQCRYSTMWFWRGLTNKIKF